jgi:hypothetical protein
MNKIIGFIIAMLPAIAILIFAFYPDIGRKVLLIPKTSLLFIVISTLLVGIGVIIGNWEF